MSQDGRRQPSFCCGFSSLGARSIPFSFWAPGYRASACHRTAGASLRIGTSFGSVCMVAAVILAMLAWCSWPVACYLSTLGSYFLFRMFASWGLYHGYRTLLWFLSLLSYLDGPRLVTERPSLVGAASGFTGQLFFLRFCCSKVALQRASVSNSATGANC